MSKVLIRRCLISVSDKTGLLELGRALHAAGVEIISTGGTAKALEAAGIPVKEVSAHTGFPEIMNGRVKTLHSTIHGGLLGRRDSDDHMKAMETHGIAPIDLLVVNLYPFEDTVAAGADFDDCIENIDIGGPALIRGAAKNHDFVAVITDPQDYAEVIQALADGGTTLQQRRVLAARAYARTGAYDAAIAQWFAAQIGDTTPRYFTLGGRLKEALRYGENPYQSAALYTNGTPGPSIAHSELVQGKELSYNNLLDADAAFQCVSELVSGLVIVKHGSPSGVVVHPDLCHAYRQARACDPVSAFGGIVAINRMLTRALAEELVKHFLEVVVAPEVSAEARSVLAQKPNLRVLETGGMHPPLDQELLVRSISGGFLISSPDNKIIKGLPRDLEIVTQNTTLTDEERDELVFAFAVAKHVKSNAVVYTRNGATIGIGSGQPNRVDSARIALRKAHDMQKGMLQYMDSPLKGAVIASDAFFPEKDGLDVGLQAGARLIIQPGGGKKDQEIIALANSYGAVMVLTGMRHFRH